MKGAEAGVVIGDYELVRRIGRGGMAEVWVARRPLGKKGTKFVALKLIADHFTGDERYRRMFRAEAELAAVLSHANIVQVFDEGEHDGRSYLVMEWVDGLNLLKLGAVLSLLDDEDRRLRVIAYIIGQLLHALNYAHSITSFDGSPLGVVHRDVSPQNVLVSNHGEVKLTDFGVAFHNFEESSGIHVKGKVRYMSPEQMRGETRRATVDLYAVGALLHELLDGKKFRGELLDGQELFSTVLSGEVSPLSRPAPPELEHLRLALLEPDPNERIQTAEHAIAMLKRYPGYGDARDELTKLCGSLTGVVKPRVGPGQSSKVAAADRRTTQWSGRRWALAKPQVGVPARPAPASQAPPRPASWSQPPTTPPRITGSTAEVEEAAGAQVRVSEAVITGETEFVERRSLQALLDRTMSPSPSPTHVAGQPSASISAEVGHSGWVDHPGWAPTERMLATPQGTEVIGARMMMEPGVGSATEQEMLPPLVPGDGSETSRVRPGMPVQRKPASVGAIGVGLVLVAIMSVSVTWLVFSREGEAQADAGAEAEVRADGEAEPGLGTEVAASMARAASELEAPAVDDEVPTPVPMPVPMPVPGNEVPAVENGDLQTEVAELPAGATPIVEDDALEPAIKDAPRSSKRASKVPIKVRASGWLHKAQVRIGKQVIAVGASSTVSAGRKKVEWRKSPSESWRSDDSWNFRGSRTVMIFITKDGLKIRKT